MQRQQQVFELCCICLGEVGEYIISVVSLLMLMLMLEVEVEVEVVVWIWRWWRDFGELGEEGCYYGVY